MTSKAPKKRKKPKSRKATPRKQPASALSADALKVLVDNVIALGNQMRLRDDFGDTLAVPAPPADPEVLARFRRQLGDRVPPSFVTLLSIYDGIVNFDWVDVSIHGTRYLCEHPHLDVDRGLEDWGMFDLAQGAKAAYRADSIFLFGQGPNSSLLGFLTRERDASGEMAVMEFDPGGPIWTFPSFAAYLRGRAKWFRKYLAESGD